MADTTKTDGVLIVSETSKKLDKAFIKLEREIRVANKSFLIIGKNLTTINECKYYQQRGFGTFELYVSTIFDFTRDYAYKIIAATRVYGILERKFKPCELPKAETHCRPLTKIEDDKDIVKIWTNVVATNKITQKTVVEMVDLHLGKGAPTKSETPDTGTESTDTEPGSVEAGNETDETSAEQKVLILQARVTQLENDLEKARSAKGGIAETKIAKKMIQAGFVALSQTATDDQKDELIATKKALLG